MPRAWVYGFGGLEWWNGMVEWTGLDWTGLEWNDQRNIALLWACLTFALIVRL